jgi:hypothetical protein
MARLFQHFVFPTFLALVPSVSGAEPRTVKAKVGEPVVQELMGGCSLRCVVAWKVEIQSAGGSASSTKLLNDESAESAWMASSGAAAVGTKFRIAFAKKLPPGMEGQIPLYGLDLINGNWKEESDWKSFGRIKRARLSYNERPIATINFSDSRRWMRAEFDDLMLRGGDVLTLEVLEVYPGSVSPLAVSEIVLQGGH